MNVQSEKYSIARPSGKCAQTGITFQAGEQYIATLVERDDEDGLDRIDYSLDAWHTGVRPERLFGFWRAVMPDPDVKPKLFIDDDDLLGLFDQLEDAQDEKRQGFRFLLALILLRKRLLRQVGVESKQGRRSFLFKRRGRPDDPPTSVLEVHLQNEALEAATEQLGAALRGDA